MLAIGFDHRHIVREFQVGPDFHNLTVVKQYNSIGYGFAADTVDSPTNDCNGTGLP